MTKLEIFKTLMTKAKANGYTGPDGEYEVGRMIDGTNYYAIVFREDFAKALWGSEKAQAKNSTDLNQSLIPKWKWVIERLVISENKWEYLEKMLSN